MLFTSTIDTPLGKMLAIGDEKALYLLEFADQIGLERAVKKIQQRTRSQIVAGSTSPLVSIEKELQQYFQGKLRTFKTPLFTIGSPFQQEVWHALQKISFGKTKSYRDMAEAIAKPTAFRAVARANSTNLLAIIIPCHRVINSDGNLGGYAGGINRKEWLLTHEKNLSQ